MMKPNELSLKCSTGQEVRVFFTEDGDLAFVPRKPTHGIYLDLDAMDDLAQFIEDQLGEKPEKPMSISMAGFRLS